MRISTKNARLLRQMIEDAMNVRDLGFLRNYGRVGMKAYWETLSESNDYYARSRKTSELWQKVRGRVGD